jgi:hypothetical protein
MLSIYRKIADVSAGYVHSDLLSERQALGNSGIQKMQMPKTAAA